MDIIVSQILSTYMYTYMYMCIPFLVSTGSSPRAMQR